MTTAKATTTVKTKTTAKTMIAVFMTTTAEAATITSAIVKLTDDDNDH